MDLRLSFRTRVGYPAGVRVNDPLPSAAARFGGAGTRLRDATPGSVPGSRRSNRGTRPGPALRLPRPLLVPVMLLLAPTLGGLAPDAAAQARIDERPVPAVDIDAALDDLPTLPALPVGPAPTPGPGGLRPPPAAAGNDVVDQDLDDSDLPVLPALPAGAAPPSSPSTPVPVPGDAVPGAGEGAPPIRSNPSGLPEGQALAQPLPPRGTADPETLRGRSRSTSASGQFVVVADELQVRGMVASMCEELKRQLLSLLSTRDEWRTPVVVVVHSGRPEGGSGDFQPRMRRLQGGGFHLQLDVWVHERFRRQAFQEEMLRLLLAEIILREVGDGELPVGRSLLPSWLHLGLSETVTYRQRGFPSALFASVFRAGRQLSVEEILRTEPYDLDSVSAEVFRASACALVQTLLDQPGGARQLQAYIRSLPRSDADPWELLTEHFPALAGPGSLEKWWALQMATLATPTPFESMSATETENRLRQILQVMVPIDPETGERKADGDGEREGRRFRVPLLHRWLPGGDRDGDDSDAEDAERDNPAPVPRANLPGAGGGEWSTIPIRDWPAELRRDELNRQLSPVLRGLEGLAMRAHPLYQPVVKDYNELITSFGAGNRIRDWDERLDYLERERATLARRCREVEDYLDWWEASHSQFQSGEFDRYLEAADRLEAELPPREDELSRYLDQLGQEYR